MKINAGRRDDGIAAATLLAAVLFGCLATSVQCARVVPADATTGDGERGQEAELALPPPFCYKACGNGRCDFCCASQYTPTFCWDTQAMCKRECHPPISPPSSV
ncbi:uncharacterized protein [Zea mays]|uniref:Uncharacterized protein n=1 Tax=Zea mays TaxID=4577 RepID=A0A1D6LWI1_MAIZE|nr:uncharacterized protein LOC103629976 [Zea mays]AQK83591.1 hypothetical protein ZEAMMB73_Zm00001d037319 [Zea mays]|eukprot:XP_008649296.1 uncharacterized protein LOC103629976 [Zea mays]